VPKRRGFLYDRLTSWPNLYLAYRKACKHKKNKDETAEWMFNCEHNLLILQDELIEHSYQPQAYKYFRIQVPKERIISVASFRDRVVHHALVNIIEPYFEATFIKDSYATRKEKGLHLAVENAQSYACRHQWYLKLDIEKFFASVSHEILLKLINRKIKDPKVMALCRIILQNQTLSMGLQHNRGLPVGNLTSQFFANIYLNKLDYFIKQNLGYRGYVRYMDDFILFSNNPISLQQSLGQIQQFLAEELQLRIKPKSIQLNKTLCGIPFLGYRVYPRLLRVRNENLKRCLKGIKRTEKEYVKGKISSERLYQSTRSRLGFIGYANSSRLLYSIWGRNQQAVPTV
jgi:RNA-directed DNA polymerase